MLAVAISIATAAHPVAGIGADTSGSPSTEGRLASIIAALPEPLGERDFVDYGKSDARYELGRLLFFDPVLSGNRNISCGTCHDPALGTSDGVALSIGEGGVGQGPARRTGPAGVSERVPRNAQALYNIGAREYPHFFFDGRLHAESTHVHGAGFQKLAGEQFPDGLESLLAAQALFPVTSPVEMAGQPGENPIADAVAEYRLAGPQGAWDLIAARLRRLPGYVLGFRAAFADIESANDIRYVHAANALATFQSRAFRSTDSRFDRLLATHDVSGWSQAERDGLALFYGKSGCADCHAGALLTDHDFHAIAMPQIGPGKGHGSDRSYLVENGFADRLEDEGRYRVSRDLDDLFRFRTPSLRNVAVTAPYGHAGAYTDLAAVIRHHLDPVTALHAYSRERAESLLPALDTVIDSVGRGARRQFFRVAANRRAAYDRRRGHVQGSTVLRSRIAANNDLEPILLSDAELDDLVAFLHTLTDSVLTSRTDFVPAAVPSGLMPEPRKP